MVVVVAFFRSKFPVGGRRRRDKVALGNRNEQMMGRDSSVYCLCVLAVQTKRTEPRLDECGHTSPMGDKHTVPGPLPLFTFHFGPPTDFLKYRSVSQRVVVVVVAFSNFMQITPPLWSSGPPGPMGRGIMMIYESTQQPVCTKEPQDLGQKVSFVFRLQ